MSSFDLQGEGRHVLITGGATGMGAAMATAFGAAGYGVAVLDVDAEAGQQRVARLQADGVETLFVAADVADEAQVEAAFATALERFGSLDVVISNAGICGPEVALHELAERDFDRVIGVDLKGPFLVSKQAVRAQRQRGGGAIIHIASIVAASGAPSYPAYSAAKAGVVALTRSLARSVGRFNIRVNCISPGSITGTQFLAAERGQPLDKAEAQRLAIGLIRKIPLGRPGRPEDVAHLALFIASPLARHLHGAVLTLDGGESLGQP